MLICKILFVTPKMFQFLIYCTYATQELQRTQFSRIPENPVNGQHGSILVGSWTSFYKQLIISSSDLENYVRFLLGGARVIIMPKSQIYGEAENHENNLIISQPFDLLQSEENKIVEFDPYRSFYDNELCKTLERELFNINNNVEQLIEYGYSHVFRELTLARPCFNYFPQHTNTDDLTAKELWENIYDYLKSDKGEGYAKLLGLNTERDNLGDDIDKKRDFIIQFYYAMCFPYTSAYINLQPLFSEIKDDKGRSIKIEEGDLYFVEFNIILWNKKKLECDSGYCPKYETISSEIYCYMGEDSTRDPPVSSEEYDLFIRQLDRTRLD